MDHAQYLNMSTMLLNEGSSQAGPHHDMPCPCPALVCGQGMCELRDGQWHPRGVGGRLFVADGLFDISYGPTDVVLLDGNVLHGITSLRDQKGKGQHKKGKPELERFSVIMFSSFKREGGMWGHGKYQGMWEESWMSGLAFKKDS